MSAGKERGERKEENESEERRETGRKRAGRGKSDREEKGCEGHLHARLVS